MGLGHFFIAKEENMSETGKKTKCMVKEFFITPVKKLLMMDNGKMINYQVLELYTTKR